jgi:methionine aminopeptidase
VEILRNLFGSFASGVIRLIVGVAILAAAYFFIVKPVLKTTDHAIDSANQSFEKSFGPGADITDISGTIESVNRKVQREIRKSFKAAEKAGGGNPNKLVKCVQRAHGDVHKIQRCTVKF